MGTNTDKNTNTNTNTNVSDEDKSKSQTNVGTGDTTNAKSTATATATTSTSTSTGNETAYAKSESLVPLKDDSSPHIGNNNNNNNDGSHSLGQPVLSDIGRFEKAKDYENSLNLDDLDHRNDNDGDGDGDGKQWNNEDTLQTNNVTKGCSASLTDLFQTPSPPRAPLGPVLSTPNLGNLQTQQEGTFPSLSIPELSMGKRGSQNSNSTNKSRCNNDNKTHGDDDDDDVDNAPSIAFRPKNAPSVHFHASFTSESSLGSEPEVDDTDEASVGAILQRSQRTLTLDSSHRVSLTVDMVTGKSPGTGKPAQYHRGQVAELRRFSSGMMEAQSPRVRRRRARSKNIGNLRNEAKKIKKILTLPSTKGANDAENSNVASKDRVHDHDDNGRDRDHDASAVDICEEGVVVKQQQQQQQKRKRKKLKFPRHIDMANEKKREESNREAHRNRRNRFIVEQKSVSVIDQKQIKTRQVQYRLAAITPTELRKRRYRKRYASDTVNTNGFGLPKTQNDCCKLGNLKISNKFRAWLESAKNYIVEFSIATMSHGKTYHSAGYMNKLLYWSFRNNLTVVFILAALSFYLSTLVFAVCLYLIGRLNPKCIQVGSENFADSESQFMDAFALSWTTFTTVGYGLVYPATSATTTHNLKFGKDCAAMTIVATFEAFMGILFSALWGALLFTKVIRVAAFAQVSFSDAVVIKYGGGLRCVADDDEYESSSDDDVPSSQRETRYEPSKLPCPIFEFRIANRLNNRRGGEIIDASINIVASMEESQGSGSHGIGDGGVHKQRRRGKRSSRQQSRNYKSKKQSNHGFCIASINSAREAANEMIATYQANLAEAETSPTGGTEPVPNNQVFSKLMAETMEHPFFNRVWNVRHVLDESSPLLKQEAKELIRINKGHWPQELNSAIGVRASIHFHQILVSFSGTSNVDANSVYCQKVYNLMDVCVGYAFCNMLFRETDGSIGVDHKLLNDVKEQAGGGGESLDLIVDDKPRAFMDIFIL